MLSECFPNIFWRCPGHDASAAHRKTSANHLHSTCRAASAEPPRVTLWLFYEQEEYIKEEQRSLKRELLRAQEEVKRIQSVPLVIGQFLEMVDGNSGIVGSTTGGPMPLIIVDAEDDSHYRVSLDALQLLRVTS